MIRELTTKEFEEKYLDLVEKEYTDLDGGNHVEFDKYSMIDMMNLCEGNRQLCIIADELDGNLAGIVVAMLIPSYMNMSHWTAYNMIWFVFKEYRKTDTGIRLIKAYEEWAVRMGIRDIHIGLAIEGRKGTKRYFKKLGYEPYQTTYIKRLF